MIITLDLLKACNMCESGIRLVNDLVKQLNTSSLDYIVGVSIIQNYADNNPGTDISMDWTRGIEHHPVAVKFYNDYTRGNYGFPSIDDVAKQIYITDEDGSVIIAQYSKPINYTEFATLEETKTARLVYLEEYITVNTETIHFSILEEIDTVGQDGITPALRFVNIDEPTFLQEQKETKYQIFNFETREYEKFNTFADAKNKVDEMKTAYLDIHCPIKQKVTNSTGDWAWDDFES
jgi:hypothetical protein